MTGLAVFLSNATTARSVSLRDQLIGTWGYVSSTAKAPDGGPLWGANPRGLMILTNDGHFSWQVFRSDRPRFASNDRLNATTNEYKAAIDGSLAYFGTYLVDESNKAVRFKIEASTYPNSEGEELTRIITSVSTQELKYMNPATTLGAEVEAVWKRIR
jgi:hypothetical protein